MTEHRESVGSLAEEAFKLLDAIRDRAGEPTRGDAGASQDSGQGRADGARDACACRVCPICRGIEIYRAVTPEVRTHLAHAATAFVQNLAETMEASRHPEHAPGWSGAADRHREQDDGPPAADD